MRIPSHNTLAAYGALFVALGGTSYAALRVPAQSVGTTQLKNGAVTRQKIAKNAQPFTRHAITDIVATDMTSDQVLTALSDAVRGDTGPTGLQGPTGTTGPAGTNGKSGTNGAPGTPGAPGAPGAKGEPGPQGDQGAIGAPGSTVASGYIPSDGTNADLDHLTLARHTTTGLYCLDTDKGAISNPRAAVVTMAGDGSTVYSVGVEKSPNSGGCAGHDFAVTVMQGGTVTDAAFYVLIT